MAGDLSGRTLVLGVGGLTGIAWLCGLLAALEDEGVDLRGADRVIGTSAGAMVAARVAAGRPMARDARVVAGRWSPVRAAMSALYRLAPKADSGQVQAMIEAMDHQGPSTPEWRRGRGRDALAARTMPERAFVAMVGAVVRLRRWPATPLTLVAVDAATGAVVPLDRAGGVPVVRAAAASAAVPGVYPPVHLTGRACIDGGTRASLNADLAAGARSALLIVDHIPTGGEGPLSAAAIRRDADALAASGTRVVMIQPDAASQTTLERPLDPGMLVAAGAAGRRQGREEAARVAAGWR